MRLKEMTAGTPLATCDGGYVVPEAPVSSKYVEYVVLQNNREEVFIDIGETDPWGPCHPSDKPKNVRVRGRGVKVRAFEVDENGKPEGKGWLTVVPARDIKGTWKQYMSLHAVAVRKKGLDRKAQLAEQEGRKAISKRLRDELEHDASLGKMEVYIRQPWFEDRKRLPEGTLSVQVTFNFTTQELDAFIRRYKKGRRK